MIYRNCIYGDKNCTLNAHLLIHLTKYVRLWGPLWTTSEFGFESMNGYITSMIHSKHKVADRLLFSLDVSNTLSTLADNMWIFQEHVSNFAGNLLSWNSTIIVPFVRRTKSNLTIIWNSTNSDSNLL